MNRQNAYNVAAALERKMGENINLASTNKLWQWCREDGAGHAVVKTTDAAPAAIAQMVYNSLKHPPVPPSKRRKDADDE